MFRCQRFSCWLLASGFWPESANRSSTSPLEVSRDLLSGLGLRVEDGRTAQKIQGQRPEARSQLPVDAKGIEAVDLQIISLKAF